MSGALVIKRFNMTAKFDFYFDQEAPVCFYNSNDLGI